MKRVLVLSLAAVWLTTIVPAGARPDQPYHTYHYDDCAVDPISVPASCAADAWAHPIGSARLQLRVDAGPAHPGTGLGVTPAKARASGAASIFSFADIDEARDETTVRVTLYVNAAGVMLDGNLPGPTAGTGGYADLSVVLTHTTCGTCLGSSNGMRLASSHYEEVTAGLGELTLEATMSNYGDPIPPGRILIEVSSDAAASLGHGSLLGDTGTAQAFLEFRVIDITVG